MVQAKTCLFVSYIVYYVLIFYDHQARYTRQKAKIEEKKTDGIIIIFHTSHRSGLLCFLFCHEKNIKYKIQHLQY